MPLNMMNDNGLDLDDDGPVPEWANGLPAALAKAIHDQPFQYALMLRDGTIFEFEGADRQSPAWILLHRPRMVSCGYNPCFDRGVEVRLADIVWVADAPHGS